jgi:hypothetical protein
LFATNKKRKQGSYNQQPENLVSTYFSIVSFAVGICKKLKQVEQPTSPFAITTPSLEKQPFFAVKRRLLFRASNFFNVHPFLQLT